MIEISLLCIYMPAIDRSLSDCVVHKVGREGAGAVAERRRGGGCCRCCPERKYTGSARRHVPSWCEFHFKMMKFCIQNDELCVKNDRAGMISIKIDELCINNDELCVKNDEF